MCGLGFRHAGNLARGRQQHSPDFIRIRLAGGEFADHAETTGDDLLWIHIRGGPGQVGGFGSLQPVQRGNSGRLGEGESVVSGARGAVLGSGTMGFIMPS